MVIWLLRVTVVTGIPLEAAKSVAVLIICESTGPVAEKATVRLAISKLLPRPRLKNVS
ncbi:MAG: hypothetical protein L3J88_01650 [Gammaproteobacteria bacterium]|nr:hypothetical protein [Gammaproteobacteria bacterium]MCF6362070.1 hypothetical protein [Gammaproteobacteria bacterium]